MMLDDLNFLCYTKTKDAQHNRNKPKRLLDVINERDKKKKQREELVSFASIEEYEQHMNKIMMKYKE